MKSERINTSLNGICAYFTMFPLEFPYGILERNASFGEWVIDPFCGRGTTNFASRVLGLPSIGIDSSPVAAASSEAKLANTTPEAIVEVTRDILSAVSVPQDVPQGEFWEWAFHKDVLAMLCRLREGLLSNCSSDTRRALRAIILGALHGPRQKTRSSYFSNQSQRTYAPKPSYAVRYWKSNKLLPPFVDVVTIIRDRAYHYYGQQLPIASGKVILGDSRNPDLFNRLRTQCQIRWVVTSPPYYGMRSYIPDQWLRSWFLGGPAQVAYSMSGQIEHSSPEHFADQLRQVWRNVGSICMPAARMIIRFGGIHDRKANPLVTLKNSLKGSGWTILNRRSAGFASQGHRQALHFSKLNANAIEENDVWTRWEG